MSETKSAADVGERVCKPAIPITGPARFVPPPQACDAHVHVFGDPARYPYAAERSFTPSPGQTLAALDDLHRTLGLARSVIVQSGVQGPAVMLDALLRQFDLAARLDEPSDKLPYGLQKMLGLLLAYATRPKVLLLDEPAAGLERRERGMVDAFVQAAQADHGCSVLIVEHDMDLIRRLCPRILVLDAGHVLAEGTPETVLARRDVIDAYMGIVDKPEHAARC